MGSHFKNGGKDTAFASPTSQRMAARPPNDEFANAYMPDRQFYERLRAFGMTGVVPEMVEKMNQAARQVVSILNSDTWSGSLNDRVSLAVESLPACWRKQTFRN